MKNYIKLLFLIILLSIFKNSSSQVVYEHISNQGIYNFLDEMANMKVIELNDIIKPYSRSFIFEKLKEIKTQRSRNSELNYRQKKELDFYLKAFLTENNKKSEWPIGIDVINSIKGEILTSNPIGSFYKDDNFTLGIQPVVGVSYHKNDNGNLTKTYGGASIYGYIGKNIGFYSSIRDNNVSQKTISPQYLVQDQGVPFKNYGAAGIDYSEARGGLTYAWEWGSIGLVKDNVQWGTGYHGTNIQSGRTPSYAMIKLNLRPVRWFEFNYFHGWLNSQVVDSVNSYISQETYRVSFRSKFIASNMFTFYPIKNLNFSFGNSIVYSDVGGINGNYLIPFLFYKSVDHTLNGVYVSGEAGQNSQMFVNLSSRNIKHLHLFFTLYADDLSFRHFKNKDEYNLFSYKVGFRLSNYPLQNLSLTFEFTHTNPLTFQHKIETQTFASSNYNLGHYLTDNAREIYLAANYKPIRGLNIELSYTYAKKGGGPTYAECANDPNCDLHTIPILNPIVWDNHSIGINSNYEFASNANIFINVLIGDITGDVETYTPEFYWGKTTTISAGFNIGF